MRSFDSWAVVYRSSDDAQWLAHSVQYNLMAWADTPAEARAALERVMEEALLDDLNSGFDSERRPAAPPEVQELLERLFRTGRSVDMSAPDVAEREQVKTFAFQLSFTFFAQRDQDGHLTSTFELTARNLAA